MLNIGDTVYSLEDLPEFGLKIGDPFIIRVIKNSGQQYVGFVLPTSNTDFLYASRFSKVINGPRIKPDEVFHTKLEEYKMRVIRD